jgi:energy-coupling factor transport system substrate-specific component
MRQTRSALPWAILSGTFGLLFGALCAPVDVVIGGFGYAAAKWVSGIPFDVAHCIGNFAIALVMFVPMRNLLEKLYAKLMR